MQLRTVYARFFRSLNHDYLRASDDRYLDSPDPWDATPAGVNYPFVRLHLERDVTTVVGGNESGKSQMLGAIRGALTGGGFDRSDFCRYSPFFADDAEMVLPEFGAVFTGVTADDVTILEKATETRELGAISRVALFRMNVSYKHRAYVEVDGEWSEPLNVKTPTLLRSMGVPTLTTIDSDIPLPDTVPLEFLVSGKPVKQVSFQTVQELVDKFRTHRGFFGSVQAVQDAASDIYKLFGDSDVSQDVDGAKLEQYKLAGDLLYKVAKVDPDQVKELRKAVNENNGYAASLVDSINTKLAKALNFPHWWTQDSQFELYVTCTELDLKFMIRDRTNKSYSFAERSDGLKYFLSYFVQYLAHEPPAEASAEVLLMDEPDRYLSSSAQQDLLRIFEDFAHPQDPDRLPVQVVYVTHSPFLIDKNDARRIRVLEKGEYDEGTRVVASVAANHYEPLRSAFGSFVAETTFISGSNLIVEGPSDQVLVAGTTRWLKKVRVAERDRLNLNTVTIVPAGGTPHVPYMVYLARGRDVEKPAIVVLLDADQPGNQARKELQQGGAKRKPLIDDNLVCQYSDTALDAVKTENPAGRVAIEDLIPLNVAIDAAARFCREFVPDINVHSFKLKATDIFPNGVADGKAGSLKALESVIRLKSGNDSFELTKIGFARSVSEVLLGEDGATSTRVTTATDLDTAKHNFSVLLSHLARLERAARRAKDVDRISTKVNRIKREFERTHPKTARREDVLDLIESVETQLDFSAESDQVRETMGRWRDTFKLADDPSEPIEDYDALTAAVRSLAYQAVRASESASPGSSD